MAFPTIIFNSSTGSDTAASGAGPATALTGTAASYSGSVFTLDGSPDLSGVATDGSACIHVATSSGRQFFKITGTDNTAKTVTVANAPAGTTTGLAWQLGGKRATIDNATSRIAIVTDALPGWVFSIDDSTAAALTSSLAPAVSGDTTSGPITVMATSSVITMNQTANAFIFQSSSATTPDQWVFKNIKFTNSNGTKTSAMAASMTSITWTFIGCIFGDATNTLNAGIVRSANTPAINCVDCNFTNCVGNGIDLGGSGSAKLIGCRIASCGADAVRIGGSAYILDCLITGNSGDGIVFPAGTGGQSLIINCTISSNTGDGLDISNAVFASLSVLNNNFTANGNYGIRAKSPQSAIQSMIDYNNYGTGATANTSGSLLNLNAGAHDLAVDPGYTNAAGGNFAVGTAVQAKGFPLSTVGTIGAGQSATYSYVDIGAAQHQSVGGSLLVNPGLVGGMHG